MINLCINDFEVIAWNLGCAAEKFTIKAAYSAEESAPFINKEGTVEGKMSRGLNILATVI